MFDNKQRLGYKLNILKCAWFAHYFFLFKNVIAKSHKTTRANMIRQNMRNRYELIGKSFFMSVFFMSTIKTAVEAFYLNKNIPSASICIVLFLASNIIYDINLFIMKKIISLSNIIRIYWIVYIPCVVQQARIIITPKCVIGQWVDKNVLFVSAASHDISAKDI